MTHKLKIKAELFKTKLQPLTATTWINT